MLSFYQPYEFEFNPTEGQMLVATPLTQKCIYNLFQAVCSNMGGLINGNFGVGKTETIKSLARTMAKPFLQWSCRGGCSYSGLSRIFQGMALGGWWLSLDEINHLEMEVISTLVQQVLNIKHAVLQMKKTMEVNLAGGTKEVAFNNRIGIFATFSHNELIEERGKRGGERGGFGKYPHILMEQFRVVYMIVPDIKVILTAKLLMLGFT